MIEFWTILGTSATVIAVVLAYIQLRRTPPAATTGSAFASDTPAEVTAPSLAQPDKVPTLTSTQVAVSSPRIASSVAFESTAGSLLEPYFPASKRLLGLTPAKGFHFVIVSGCSSAGKDVLVAEVLRRIGTSVEMLKKYMTRSPRPGEPDYSVCLTPAQFEKAERSGKIIFPYHKRDFDYGFDTDDLLSAVKHGTCKIAIFTEVKKVPAIVQALRANGIPATPVFIDVDRSYLTRRSYHRNLGPNEVQKRLESIDQDLNALAMRGKTLREEYYVVTNDETAPFNASKDSFEALVQRAIEGTLSWPPEQNR